MNNRLSENMKQTRNTVRDKHNTSTSTLIRIHFRYHSIYMYIIKDNSEILEIADNIIILCVAIFIVIIISNTIIIVTEPTLRLTCELLFLMMTWYGTDFLHKADLYSIIFPHYVGKFFFHVI